MLSARQAGVRRGRTLALLLSLLLGLSGLFGLASFGRSALLRSIMRVRLFVILAARAAEKEQNFLSVFSHEERPQSGLREPGGTISSSSNFRRLSFKSSRICREVLIPTCIMTASAGRFAQDRSSGVPFRLSEGQWTALLRPRSCRYWVSASAAAQPFSSGVFNRISYGEIPHVLHPSPGLRRCELIIRPSNPGPASVLASSSWTDQPINVRRLSPQNTQSLLQHRAPIRIPIMFGVTGMSVFAGVAAILTYEGTLAVFQTRCSQRFRDH
jgi:hypothetical protein